MTLYCLWRLTILLQGLQQDILSRETMIESVKAKAQSLSLLSPGAKLSSQSTQIIQRYDNLVEKAKVCNDIVVFCSVYVINVFFLNFARCCC